MHRKFVILTILFLAHVVTLSARPYLKIQQVHSRDYPNVTAEVSVSRISPINDLREAHFQIFENGWQVGNFQVKQVNPDEEFKKVVLLFDASLSVTKKSFAKQIKAARTFIEELRVGDRLAIIGFHNVVETHCEFSGNKIAMLSCLERIEHKGTKTRLYDALLEAMTLFDLLPKEEQKRQSIIVFTDGHDEGSIVALDDLLRRSERTRVPVFLAGSGNKNKLQKIARLARVSGGEAFHTLRNSDIVSIFRMLSKLLDSTYNIQYISQAASTAQDGRKVELQIKIDIPPGDDRKTGILDADNYIYLLSAETKSTAKIYQWYTLLIEDTRYLLFLSGLIILLLVLIIIYLVVKRQKPVVHKEDLSSEIDSEEIQFSGPYGGYSQLSAAEPKFPKETVKRPYIPHDFKLKRDFRTAKVALPEQDTLASYYKAFLLEKEGPQTGRRHKIRWHSVTIGSSDENSIVIHDRTISFKHAKIELTREGYVLYDLVSEHGTWLNGKKLLRPRILNDFDEILLGRTRLLFRKAEGQG